MTPLFPFDLPDYSNLGEGQSVVIDNALFFNYNIVKNLVISGPFASFGGFYFSEKFIKTMKFTTTVSLVYQLIENIALSHKEVRFISLRLAPSVYYRREQIEFIQAVLEYCGFARSGEVSMIIDCDLYSPASSLLRNVNKATSNGLYASLASYEECFDNLAKIKRIKNYSFGLDRKRFFSQAKKFPDYYDCLIATSCRGIIEACLISLNIAGGVLLFAWDQTDEGKMICATDFLIHKSIQSAIEKKCKFVDLGTVTESGKIREGLVRHKEKFSSSAQIRNTYSYSL